MPSLVERVPHWCGGAQLTRPRAHHAKAAVGTLAREGG